MTLLIPPYAHCTGRGYREVGFSVLGSPAPQGSKRAFAVRGKDGVPTGKLGVIESSHDRVKSWRQAVLDEVKARMADWREAFRWEFPLKGALEAEMTFFQKRPQGHYRTGRNSHLLSSRATAFPEKVPDLSKLIRSTEDALTAAGLWGDDAQVVRYAVAQKLWHDPGRHLPGALIVVRELPVPEEVPHAG